MRVSDLSRKDFLTAFEEYISNLLKNREGDLGDAMRYAVLDGGKRVRPLCVYYGAKCVGGNADIKDVLPLAAAFELIHSYSLVHDDMPEMDNDEMRRGKPSVHKRFGEATALLTGDALLTLAMSQVIKAEERLSSEISNAAMEMVFGQADELSGCETLDEYIAMYSKKTGALIRGAFRVGALCAVEGDELQQLIAKFTECIGGETLGEANGTDTSDNGKRVLNMITKFAEHLGLAYQLADDLLDEDKSVISVIGREETQNLLDMHSQKAVEYAKRLECADELVAFATELWHRQA